MLEGVGRLGSVPLSSGRSRGAGFGLCVALGLELGKWLTIWITLPALSRQIAGFGLPVAAVAVSAMPAAAAATRAGAKRQALLMRFGMPMRYLALDSDGEGGTTLSRAALRRLSRPGPSISSSGIGICLMLFAGRQRCRRLK